MKRRDFVASAAALAAILPNAKNVFSKSASPRKENSESLPLVKPQVLKKGDLAIAVAPGTAAPTPEEIGRAKEILDYLGLKYVFGASVLKGSNYKTRSVQERLDDLLAAFENQNAKAVFCLRGGYGSAQLLDKIDYDLVRKNPKIFVGYSDITALEIAFLQKARTLVFHGPVLLSSFSKYTLDLFEKALFSTEPIGKITNPDFSGVRDPFPTRVIVSGKAEGELTGGNLSLIASLMGTPFEIDVKNKIFFTEDVGEAPYRIDRMLNQLKLAGKLAEAKAILFGDCVDCAKNDSASVWDLSLGQVLDYYLKPAKKPAFYGLKIGHSKNQATLPLGVRAILNADNRELEILEPATVP